MQATDVVTSPTTMDTILTVLSWLVIIFGTAWFATLIIGYMHRRSYNLTRAESGGSKAITPDFLKVDEKKRQAAIDRGAAYDKVLEERAAAERAAAAAATAGPSPVSKFEAWSRAGALISASFTLVAAVVGTLTRVDTLQKGVVQLSTGDSLMAIVQDHPVGTLVAVLVIGANIIVFAKATKKTPAKS